MDDENKNNHVANNAASLCACGCGQFTAISTVTDRRKGYEKGSPRRYVRGHNRRTSPVLFLIDDQGCWIWQRTRNTRGYGRVRNGGKMRFAHVVWYEREIGPVPVGLVLHHTCGQGDDGCMNPWHLIPVTPAENARLGRGTRLNPNAVAEIRELVARGDRTKTSIAREFGVSDVQIHHIASGRCWAA